MSEVTAKSVTEKLNSENEPYSVNVHIHQQNRGLRKNCDHMVTASFNESGSGVHISNVELYTDSDINVSMSFTLLVDIVDAAINALLDSGYIVETRVTDVVEMSIVERGDDDE